MTDLILDSRDTGNVDKNTKNTTVCRSSGPDNSSAKLKSAEIKVDKQIGSNMQVGISSLGAWMLGVGANIGSFAFLIHANMIAQAGPLGACAAWVVAAVMMVPLALILAELSSMFPAAGGPYVYKYVALKRLIPGMGELLGFLTGWIFWIFLISSYSCMSNGLVNLLSAHIWGNAQASPIWFGLVVITALFGGATVLNLMQISHATKLNTVFTVMKILLAFGFVALVVFSPHSSLTNLWQPASLSGSGNFFANIAVILPLAIGGFSGIEMAGCTASETQDARKSVPRAIMMTVVTITLMYVGICGAICFAQPYVLSADKTVALVSGTKFLATLPSMSAYLLGPIAGLIATTGVVLSIVSCGFSGLLVAARTSYSMAETGLFPKVFCELHPQTKVPQYALVFQCIFMAGIGIVAYLLGKTGLVPDAYSFLGSTCGFLYALLALLYGVCLMGLRYTDPDMPRPFRLGKSGNSVAWLFAIGSAVPFAVVAFACTGVAHQLGGVVLLLLGVPVYGYYRWRK
jgi:amino acid transporter